MIDHEYHTVYAHVDGTHLAGRVCVKVEWTRCARGNRKTYRFNMVACTTLIRNIPRVAAHVTNDALHLHVSFMFRLLFRLTDRIGC